jgi:hypothetical protein
VRVRLIRSSGIYPSIRLDLPRVASRVVKLEIRQRDAAMPREHDKLPWRRSLLAFNLPPNESPSDHDALI